MLQRAEVHTNGLSSELKSRSRRRRRCCSCLFLCWKAFLTVVRETVHELGLDAANEAIEEEAIRMEEMHTRYMYMYTSAHVCVCGGHPCAHACMQYN